MDFNFFSKEEERYLKRWQKIKDAFLQPLCLALHKQGITPDSISYLGFLMVLPFIYFFRFNPWIALVFLLLNLFFDALDGALARAAGKQSAQGAFLDHIICDQLSFFVIFMTFIYFGLLNGFWATLYFSNYILALALTMYCQNKDIRYFPILRSKLFIYLALLIWLWSGNNFFDAFLIFFGLYMAIVNIILLNRIRCSLQ